MKFRMFTDAISGEKIAVNVDKVLWIGVACKTANTTYIHLDYCFEDGGEKLESVIEVSESFDIVFSRLNTIAE